MVGGGQRIAQPTAVPAQRFEVVFPRCQDGFHAVHLRLRHGTTEQTGPHTVKERFTIKDHAHTSQQAIVAEDSDFMAALPIQRQPRAPPLLDQMAVGLSQAHQNSYAFRNSGTNIIPPSPSLSNSRLASVTMGASGRMWLGMIIRNFGLFVVSNFATAANSGGDRRSRLRCDFEGIAHVIIMGVGHEDEIYLRQ